MLPMLPMFVYKNRVVPDLGDWFYVVPESDAIVASVMEVTEARLGGFSCGEFSFSATGSFGHVGKNVSANAYSSIAAYWAVTLIPKLGWRAHEQRRDVFTRIYTNARITPHIKRVATIQIDHRDDYLILNGNYLGEGQNMLAEASERFSILQNDSGAGTKIRSFLDYCDVIIRGSYAMNVTKESALGRATQIQSNANFDRGVE